MRLASCILLMVIFFFLLTISHAAVGKAMESKDVVLSPSDQMILRAIDKINERIDKLNDRIDKLNERFNERFDELNKRLDKRFDNLWITMLGGFLGVMAFIGGIVFWDRRTFLRYAREECRIEIADDRQKLDAVLAAMRKLGNQFPEVREVLRGFGLL
jgi:tetrahydromethanopterin S-methyltransferase subunit B